ncbi:MAG: DNA polymerase/3'-5' exonuclease PolX [Armatimonadetes bacterium]|nr:DNA polymerase/3'-5' exonuclease PolX [Armatimonadota bacterium]
MTNVEIAAVLAKIADLLEILNENPFKVRSFRRAVETVSGLAEEATELVAEGRLVGLPGIGKSIAEVITELVRDGRTAHLDDLLEKVPESLLEMLRVPGFGPRKASVVYEQLGLTTLDELEAAARAGQLRQLPGFGAKTEQKILEGIELVRAGQDRWLLGEALPLAEEFVARLRAHPEVLAAEMGGSTRRRRETVGDLDLLATSNDPAAVCAWFAREGGLATVEMAGDTKVSGRTERGLQVDLRVVKPESFGALVNYFTGSKEHNIRLRERAQRMELTLNEYGLYRGIAEDKGDQVAGENEEGIYAALGLPLIPPELREDRGEIEAAEAGRLPHLLTDADMRCDLHMHTNASDGQLPLAEMVAAAREYGYSHIGITDHSASLYVANGLDRDRLWAEIQAIRELNAELGDFTVLAGIEADILSDGTLDIPEDLWPELDFVIASIHQGFSQDADRMTARVLKAITSDRMDVLGHPTGRLVLERPPYGLHLDDVLDAAREHDVAMEVSSSPHRLDLNDAHCRLAVERGVKLCINTDAHGPKELALLRYGVMTARRGWVEAPSVINTWPLPKLRQWLGQRRRA